MQPSKQCDLVLLEQLLVKGYKMNTELCVLVPLLTQHHGHCSQYGDVKCLNLMFVPSMVVRVPDVLSII